MGRPKNTPETIWKFIDKSGGDSACWPWTGCLNHKGYGVITINWKSVLVHRIALESVIGKLPEGQCSLHRCDRPVCCNPNHLFAGTKSVNHADMMAKGRNAKGEKLSEALKLVAKRGEDSASAKLSEAQVLEIRNLYATTKIKVGEIAKRCGTTVRNVKNIISGKTWSHIENICETVKIQNRKGKLSEDTVREIRQLRKTGLTIIEIAHKFELSKFTINDIVYRRTWKDLKE